MISLVICSIIITLCDSQSREPFPDLTDQRFENDCLDTHNFYRSLHNASLLQTNQSIVTYAKTRCNTTSQSEALINGHNGLVGYGENLYWGGSSAPIVYNCSEAVRLWSYEEIRDYNFSNPRFSLITGHFTQLVWNSTTTVGCARCGGRGLVWYETYVVCNYYPPGNFIGRFQRNVFSPV